MEGSPTLKWIAEVSHTTESEIALAIVAAFLSPARMPLAVASQMLGLDEADVISLLTKRMISTPFNHEDVELRLEERRSTLRHWQWVDRE